MTGSKYYETLLESLSDIETMSDDAMGTPPSSLGRRFSLTSSELTPDSLSRSFSNGSPLSSPHFPSTPTSISCQTGSDGWFVHHHGLPIETSDGERNFRTEFAPFNDAPTKSPHDMVETCHPSDFDWVPSNGGNPSCYGPNTLVSDRMMPAFQDLSLAFGTCLGRPFGDNHIHSAFENIVGSSSEGSRAPIAMTSAVVNNFPILPSFEAGSTACPDMSWPNARSSLSSETTVPWTSLVSGLSARTDPKPMQLRSSALKSASMLDIRCMGSQGSPVPSPEAEMVPDIKREEDVSSARFPKYNHVQRAIRKCVMSSKPDIKAIRREKRGSAASKRKSKREKVILPSKIDFAWEVPLETGKKVGCSLCTQTFERREHMRRHERSVHLSKQDWKHTCRVCDHKFNRGDNLSTHILTHIKGHGRCKNPQVDVTTLKEIIRRTETPERADQLIKKIDYERRKGLLQAS